MSPENMSPERRGGASHTADEDKAGFRAGEAFVRPTPMATFGTVKSFGFDLKNCTFHLSLTAPNVTPEDAPTEVYLPEFHFPSGGTTVETSGGKWTISTDERDGGLMQKLRWWHAQGEQQMTVKGVKRKAGGAIVQQDDDSYIEQYRNNCAVM